MAIEPRTSHIERGGGQLAYQVVGEGSPHRVVLVFEAVIHLDLMWTDPSIVEAIRQGVRRGVSPIFMQQRGIGLSSPVARLPTVEEQAADVLAVMDAEGVETAVLQGSVTTALAVALLAAQHPERVIGLVLDNPVLSAPKAGPPFHGYDEADAARYVEAYEDVQARWGSGGWLPLWEPALATPAHMRLAAMLERCSASPETGRAIVESWMSFDGRDVFPQVRVPTLVLGRTSPRPLPESATRAVAEVIPGAEYRALPAPVLGDSMGSSWVSQIREITDMCLGVAADAAPPPDRVLASVLFTDVVGSTARLSDVGDAAWARTLGDLDTMVRRELHAAGGRLVNDTGDGALCELPGPAVAVRCAQAICARASELGVELRAGVHTGECERRGENLGGMAVHIGARVCAAAGPGEVLVSRTVHDLMTGSGVDFGSRGVRELKGVPGEWELFAAGERQTPGTPMDAPRPTPADRLTVGLARRAPGAMRRVGRVVEAAQKRRAARA